MCVHLYISDGVKPIELHRNRKDTNKKLIFDIFMTLLILKNTNYKWIYLFSLSVYMLKINKISISNYIIEIFEFDRFWNAINHFLSEFWPRKPLDRYRYNNTYYSMYYLWLHVLNTCNSLSIRFSWFSYGRR